MDPLLQLIQQRHPGSWGRVLDAGTGDSSLAWLCRLAPESWTAVCAEESRAEALQHRYRSQIRPQDRVLVGLWQDANFLRDECFDVVIADYLLGSCDRYAPFFQEQLVERLCQASREWLYLTGLEPYPTGTDHWLSRMASLRDSVLLLTGRRPHRELPQHWVERQLRKQGAEIAWTEQFANAYGVDFVQREVGAVERNLTELDDPGLSQVLRRRCARLRKQAQELLRDGQGLGESHDYVLAARLPGKAGPEPNK